MTYKVINYNPEGTCCRMMQVTLEDGKIVDAEFTGGCSGNLTGIKHLIKGMMIEDVIARLKGIKCGSKPTSCPDQLAQCLGAFLEDKIKTNAGV